MEETTTNAATQEEAPQAQPPVDEQPAEAVKTADSEPQQTEVDKQPQEAAAPATTSEEEDLSDYWAKKGIDISTPEGQAQAAKSYREAEKAMHAKAQTASELEKQLNAQPVTVDTDNELVRQAVEKSSRLEVTVAVQNWKAANNITPEQDQKLGEYVTANPDKALLLKNGYLTLDDIYAMSGVGKVDTAEVKKQGGQEALQTLANKQRTTAPVGGATTRTAPPKDDPIAAVLSAD